MEKKNEVTKKVLELRFKRGDTVQHTPSEEKGIVVGCQYHPYSDSTYYVVDTGDENLWEDVTLIAVNNTAKPKAGFGR